MLTIEYEQSLVETAVFLAVRSDERLECELHQVVDRLYEIPDEELRQREFVPVFRNFFTKLGFDRLIAKLLAERPLIGEWVDRCVVREAAKQRAECAELLVRNDVFADGRVRRTLDVQICPQSFLDTARSITLMRRELLHVSDMLDERFAYVRETFAGEPSRQNLQRDRYRVLWDIYVEGRLERERSGVNLEKQRLERAFGRVFANGSAGIGGAGFARVFDAPSLTHRNLMDWAREPRLLFDSLPDSSQVAANTARAKTAVETPSAFASYSNVGNRAANPPFYPPLPRGVRGGLTATQ